MRAWLDRRWLHSSSSTTQVSGEARGGEGSGREYRVLDGRGTEGSGEG